MSRQTDALANIYARSLYELAEQAGGRDKIVEVAEELEQTCELARGDQAFREFLSSPVINRGKRGETLKRIFHGNITDLVLRFLLVLNNKGRLSRLESIADAYDQLVHEAFGRVEVDVFTPSELEGDQIETIKKRIGSALSKEPVVYTYTDPPAYGCLFVPHRLAFVLFDPRGDKRKQNDADAPAHQGKEPKSAYGGGCRLTSSLLEHY